MSRAKPGLLADDDQLAERCRAGDSAAFAALYERYVDRVYDFVVRLLGDREAAADVTQETFLKALQGLRTRRVQGSVRAWLFTIARNAAIDYLRRQRTTPFSQLPTPEGEEWEPDIPASGPEADPEGTARRAELAELVWQAARGLNPQDYALLDLALRQDLTPAELAQVVGMRRGAVNTRLSRLRDALEEGFTVLLLARWGREDCDELRRLLEGVALPSGLTPQLRRTVARHVETCQVCQRNRRKVVAAADLLPALMPLVPSAELKAAWWSRLEHQLATPATLPASRRIQELRHWTTGTLAGKFALGAVASVLVLVIAVGGWLAFGTVEVTATTQACPPLALRLSGPAQSVARLLGVPAAFTPGEPVRFRLPAGTTTVTVTADRARLRLAGLPVEISFRAPVTEVTWDGRPLLGRGPSTLALARETPHQLELRCD
jgi:RNA polymerase sigma factor (sigma-70 family)